MARFKQRVRHRIRVVPPQAGRHKLHSDKGAPGGTGSVRTHSVMALFAVRVKVDPPAYHEKAGCVCSSPVDFVRPGRNTMNGNPV